MKPKTLKKKLVLNKETLANLNNSQMDGIKGRAQGSQPVYATCARTCDMCMSDEYQCTEEATCLIDCTFAYSMNTRPC